MRVLAAFITGLLIGGPIGIMYYALVSINRRDDWKDENKGG